MERKQTKKPVHAVLSVDGRKVRGEKHHSGAQSTTLGYRVPLLGTEHHTGVQGTTLGFRAPLWGTEKVASPLTKDIYRAGVGVTLRELNLES